MQKNSAQLWAGVQRNKPGERNIGGERGSSGGHSPTGIKGQPKRSGQEAQHILSIQTRKGSQKPEKPRQPWTQAMNFKQRVSAWTAMHLREQ